jgi:hypothetical protein
MSDIPSIPMSHELAEENSRLREALKEFIRLDEETGLQCDDGGEIVSALHEARSALQSPPAAHGQSVKERASQDEITSSKPGAESGGHHNAEGLGTCGISQGTPDSELAPSAPLVPMHGGMAQRVATTPTEPTDRRKAQRRIAPVAPTWSESMGFKQSTTTVPVASACDPPEIDACIRKGRLLHNGWFDAADREYVDVDDARSLERRLRAAEQENRALRRLIDKGRDSNATELGLAKQLDELHTAFAIAEQHKGYVTELAYNAVVSNYEKAEQERDEQKRLTSDALAAVLNQQRAEDIQKQRDAAFAAGMLRAAEVCNQRALACNSFKHYREAEYWYAAETAITSAAPIDNLRAFVTERLTDEVMMQVDDDDGTGDWKAYARKLIADALCGKGEV